jgi:hypothetical protein
VSLITVIHSILLLIKTTKTMIKHIYYIQMPFFIAKITEYKFMGTARCRNDHLNYCVVVQHI